MPAAAAVVLAFLLGASSEAGALADGAAPPSGSGQGDEGHDEAVEVPAPVETPPPPSVTSEGQTAAPAPAGRQGESESERGWDVAPASEADLVDPWASVPVQTVMPKPPAAVRPSAPRSSATLLDPWAGAARRHVPRQLDPELRDPFHAIRSHHYVPRLAHADLRDPFKRRSGTSEAGAPLPPAAAAPAPGMPAHPDLRDPFGRRKARPTPPPAGAAPRPPAAPREPSMPPSGAGASEGETTEPGPGALRPTASPFAHLPRARRPA